MGRRQRIVLATLLLSPQQAISPGRLAEAVWGGSPPTTSRTQIAICIASLRKAFRQAGVTSDIVVTTAFGYMLQPGEHRIDASEFTRLADEADILVSHDRTVEAADRLEEALRLWRGPVLSDVSGYELSPELARLEERRLSAIDQYGTLALELGRHHQIVTELSPLVQEQPLREESRAILMLALCRCGRRAEALALYRQARKVFAEDLGLEPSRRLQNLHKAILRDDDTLLPARTRVQPPHPLDADTRLPADVPLFVGRERELADLDDLHSTGQGHGAVTLIVGQPGVGKTALAVHWARRDPARFPGGFLFTDMTTLGEVTDSDPTRVLLGRLLRGLGLPEDRIPPSRHDRARLFHHAVGSCRMLIVIDNVPASTRLDEILPNDGCCSLLATSRTRQCAGWIPSATVLGLNTLPLPDAVTLLGALGGKRVWEDDQSAIQVARYCDTQPLALVAASGRLAVKRHWSIRDLATRMENPRCRLEELSCAEPSVRLVFDQAYEELEPATAAAYRQLGRAEARELTAGTVAPLFGADPVHAAELLEQLADISMLEVVGRDPHGGFRYRMPGLVALHAGELSRAEEAGTAR